MLHLKRKKQTYTNYKKNTTVEGRIAKYTGWLAFSTILLFIATVFLAYFGFKQVEVSRVSLNDQRIYDSIQISKIESQLGISRETMQRQLRAYVYIDVAMGDAEKINKNLYESAILFSIKNSGQTPAHNLTYIFKDTIIDFPFTDKYPQIGEFQRSSHTILNPGQIPLPIPIAMKRITDNPKFELLKRGKAFLYFYGRIQYIDIFENKKFIKFGFYAIVNEAQNFSIYSAQDEMEGD